MTHLFVSRLFSHFFHDQDKLECKEPFKRFVAIGMVKGETFKTKNGKYTPSANVIKNEKLNTYFDKETNEELFKDFEKMSKSKLNGVDPQMMIKEYGVDFTRLFLLNFVHPRSDRNFLCK
jgi:leucyl-tRNA synthetase